MSPNVEFDPFEEVLGRIRRLEDETADLRTQMAAERASRQLLQRDVRWIIRVAMGSAAVVSFLISLATQLITAYF